MRLARRVTLLVAALFLLTSATTAYSEDMTRLVARRSRLGRLKWPPLVRPRVTPGSDAAIAPGRDGAGLERLPAHRGVPMWSRF